MRTMQSTLLVGPADWNRQERPRAVFDKRLAALWKATGADGAIVYGEPAEHGALAYLTNFTPKLEPSLAFIPRVGAPTLFVGGGANMLGAARPLTWVEDLKPFRDPGKMAGDWVKTLPAQARVVLIGGETMPYGTRRALDQALAGQLKDASEKLHAQMLLKDADEITAIRGACERLNKAIAAWRQAHLAGATVTDALIEAEHVAQREGAQDVRSLFSVDGGRTLRPFDIPLLTQTDPVQTYIAVRYAGYWAEGFVRAATAADPLGDKANALLRKMIAAATPGQSSRALAQHLPASAPHPLVAGAFGNGIGLFLEEAPILSTTGLATLTEGAVYSIRAAVLEGEGAIASAMLHITDTGNEVLWSSGDVR